LQSWPAGHRPQPDPPPQSTPVSWPFLTPSSHVGHCIGTPRLMRSDCVSPAFRTVIWLPSDFAYCVHMRMKVLSFLLIVVRITPTPCGPGADNEPVVPSPKAVTEAELPVLIVADDTGDVPSGASRFLNLASAPLPTICCQGGGISSVASRFGASM